MGRASSQAPRSRLTEGAAVAARALAAGCAALLLGGCDSAAAPAADPLAALLSVLPPAGYTASATATGPLDLDAARQSTPADPALLGAELGRDGFDHGYARVWVSGGNFVTFEVLRLHGAAQAQSVVRLERQQLAGAQGYFTSGDPALPGSVAYTMYGTTRSGGHDVFCQGVWFPMARDVYGVTTCSPQPAGGTEVEELAEQQYAATAPAEGVPPPSPAPSPS